MNLRSLLFPSLLAAAMALSGVVHANDLKVAAGPIEKIDGQGRIHVAGATLAIDRDTEILDQHSVEVTRGELARGMRVEVTYEVGPRGAAARRIVATLVR